MDFSQHGEQELILGYIEQHPGVPRYCVDVGAFDGVTGSNSRALLLSGWTGLLIEPDPRSFSRVAALYAERPDVACLRRAISDHRGVARMRFCIGPKGAPAADQWQYGQMTTLRRSFAAWATDSHRWHYKTGFVFVTTLTRVLHAAGAPRDIGFMSIDCEAEDLAVIRGLDFSRYRPQLLCVECDDNTRPQFVAALAERGYERVDHTRSNTLFAPRG